jgi:hypothetical protein
MFPAFVALEDRRGDSSVRARIDPLLVTCPNRCRDCHPRWSAHPSNIVLRDFVPRSPCPPTNIHESRNAQEASIGLGLGEAVAVEMQSYFFFKSLRER